MSAAGEAEDGNAVIPAPAQYLNQAAKTEISNARRILLLTIFCMAQFLDAFNNSALFPALPVVGNILGMTATDQQWVFR